jgi:hypothetical protein
LETLHLIAHPAHPPRRVQKVMARIVSFDALWCVLRWSVEGAGDLVLPAFAGAARQDGLWRTTCFELFVTTDVARVLRQAQDERGPGESPVRPEPVEGRALTPAYSEFNFSPSERWAAYDFTGYREGMTNRPMTRAPVITPRQGGDVVIFDVAIPADTLPPRPWRHGLTAVLEERDGIRSFWAPAHGRDVPDFHDPACLAATLAAPNGA